MSTRFHTAKYDKHHEFMSFIIVFPLETDNTVIDGRSAEHSPPSGRRNPHIETTPPAEPEGLFESSISRGRLVNVVTLEKETVGMCDCPLTARARPRATEGGEILERVEEVHCVGR